MNITKNTIVSFQYVLRNDKGEPLESSPSQPTTYLHGHQQIMPLIEAGLEGKTVQDKVRVTIPPEKAYGHWNENFVRVLPLSQFQQGSQLAVGMKIYPEQHQDFVMTILKIEGENVTVDANHPLAGQTLIFEIDILDVRQASDQEIQQAKSRSGLQ